jgi:choline transport protein
MANIITALIIFNTEDYEPQRWHTTMIMWLFILIPLIGNIWFRKLLNTLESAGGIVHIVFFFINIITLAVLARRSTNDFVFKTFTHNISGWTNPGIAFGLGQITMSYPLAGMYTGP